MKSKKFSNFLPEFYRDYCKTSGDLNLLDPEVLKYAAVLYCGELFVSFPRTKATLGQQKELSRYMESLGFTNIVPAIESNGNKDVEEVGSLLMYREGLDILAVQCPWGDNYYLSARYSTLEESKKVCESIYNRFRDTVDDGKIKNMFRLDPDSRQKSFLEYMYDPIDPQDDTFIKTYEFNDDVLQAIRLNRSGLLIFHGEPGTGKSSYIRWLAQQNPDMDFMLLSMVTLMQEGGIKYLSRYITKKFSVSKQKKAPRNMVIILEDSDRALQPRETANPMANVTSELLNLIDGCGPERDHVKFIFTFNMKTSRVDPAILRKGRLLRRVEFKKLSGEQLATIAKQLGITLTEQELNTGLTLAELVYHDEDTGIETKRDIGFR